MRNLKRNLLIAFVAASSLGVFGLSAMASAQKPRDRAAFSNATTAEQPLYSEYKGVRLGMSDKEVRAKLGNPTLADNELDYFIFSDIETAQVTYDTARKAKSISIDYADGVGAPNHKAVVGGDLEMKNGSLYRMERYESLGFWVSYNRTAGPVIIVTITIQKI
jgi:hypothetical protein